MPTRTFKVDALNVQVYSGPDTLAQAASQSVVKRLNRILQQQSTATIVFATGQSQLGLLRHLRQDSTVDWSRVIGFHLDEFLGLSREHPASFNAYLHNQIAQWLPFRTFNYLNGNALEPIAECDRYTYLLTQDAIDICLLGVGINGHLAFNDPAVANFDDPRWVKLVRLDTINRQQQLTSQHFSQLRDVPTHAITLSLKAIRNARYNLCCVTGYHKADILKTLLTIPPSTACPASVLRLDSNGNNSLFTDESACQFF
ncbi:6-phosphogluconolactonase [Leptolyngbya sp. Heron Island J]|uniref:6-phosphogluconolactonase n=1 Tax=Leptolyngbya sp. Heron Island J TaxID=1385935 RepID=UPI0004CEA375|nr:6-phosphogluconolactonase [Leptolyngbya sp. Heron Island J]